MTAALQWMKLALVLPRFEIGCDSGERVRVAFALDCCDRAPGGPVGSRHRQQLNGEFIAALLRDFRHGGPKAIERVRRTQPAAYLKILALLVPREHKVEHRNPVKDMTDEELEAAIEFIQKMLAT